MTRGIRYRGSDRPRVWLLGATLAMSFLLTVGFAWLWILNLGIASILNFGNRATPAVLTASGLVFTVVGWMITSRRPDNKVGWIALAIGLPTQIGSFAIEYSVYATRTVPGGLPAGDVMAWLANFIWVVPVGLLGTVLVLIYPDGRLPGRGWSITMAAAITAMVAAVFFFALMPGPLQSLQWIDNPFGLTGSESWVEFFALGFFLLAALVPISAWSLRQRYRRSHGVTRAQIKWFAAAAAAVAITYFGQFIYSVATGTLDGGSEAQRWFQTLTVGGFGAMGVAVGVAVLRYRLYEIDRIISRTVSYALVIGLLVLVVLGLVTLLAVFLPSDDPLVVAVSTLVAAALFNPVRRRVQGVIDRRFNRSRYDAQRVIGRFTASLQEQVDPGEVVEGWVEVVEDTMQPAAVGVWVRDG
jgi:hypothetical protein